MLLDLWPLVEPTPGGSIPRRPAYGDIPFSMVSRGASTLALTLRPTTAPQAATASTAAALLLAVTARTTTNGRARTGVVARLDQAPTQTTARSAFDGAAAARAVLAAEDEALLVLLLKEIRCPPPSTLI